MGNTRLEAEGVTELLGSKLVGLVAVSRAEEVAVAALPPDCADVAKLACDEPVVGLAGGVELIGTVAALPAVAEG